MDFWSIAITSLISSLLSSAVLSAIVTRIFKRIDDKKAEKKTQSEEDKNRDEGIRLLMLDSILLTGQNFVNDGYLSKTEYDIFVEKYNCYKKLGGDGYADLIFKEVTSLPTNEFQTLKEI